MIKTCGHRCEMQITLCCYCADKRIINSNGNVSNSIYNDGQGFGEGKRDLYYCPT